MEQVLNYKAFNIELLEPHLQKNEEENYTEQNKNSKKNQNKRGNRAFIMQGGKLGKRKKATQEQHRIVEIINLIGNERTSN